MSIFNVFTYEWNFTTRSASTAILLLLQNSACIATHDWLRGLAHLHCHASWRMIWWDFSCTCIVTSRSGQQPSKHSVLVDMPRTTCHVYGRKSKRKVNVMKSISTYRGRCRDSKQVGFFLDNFLYIFSHARAQTLLFMASYATYFLLWMISWTLYHTHRCLDIDFSVLSYNNGY